MKVPWQMLIKGRCIVLGYTLKYMVKHKKKNGRNCTLCGKRYDFSVNVRIFFICWVWISFIFLVIYEDL